jgi:hypothetical protein
MGKVSKYKSQSITLDGIRFDSKDEARYYELLKRKKAQGEIINFELQPKYLLQPSFKYNGKTIRAIYYIGDFLIYHLDGTEEVIDIKGMAVPVALMKRKMMQYRYPDLKLTWLSRSLKYGDSDGWIDYDELKRRRKK